MRTYVSLEDVFEELIDQQKAKLLKFGRRIIPYLTKDDILQPNDYPELENNPFFRYEEGILDGLQTAQMALQRQNKKSDY
ncbi:hypothetical protein COB11_04095 [Candidatus Aerophobetes bacterium]|uniref:Uncharacterized protein n=1 Tax=Aerophobetes bacterium TaxID=2030807 RepID=A0A2A4YI43_UNCAE|nr:MAG: hypothetical protein COB11_04095 [Candidatus Aerophobetes bacterium]